MTAPGFSVTTGICGTTSIVTQPVSSSAATSPLPRDLVERDEAVGEAADPAVAVVSAHGRERAVGGLHPEHAARRHATGAAVVERRGHRTVERGDAVGGASEKVIAIGGVDRWSVSVSAAARAGQFCVVMRALTDRELIAEFSQPTHHDGQGVEERVDVGVGGRPADADPQRPVGVGAHRREHR